MFGRLILDTTCFGALTTPGCMATLRGSLRAAGLTPWPSAVNALEIAAHQSVPVQKKLQAALFELLEGKFLLPWPYDLLRDARSFAGGADTSFWVERSGYEELFLQPDATASIWRALQAILVDTDELFDVQPNSFRPQLQSLLKKKALRDPWSGLGAFLDSQWSDPDLRAHLVSVTWDRLGVNEPAPIERLLQDEMWRLLLDIEGAAVYERAILHEQPKRAHRTDMLQLLYLAYAPLRVMATGDKAMLRQAQGILTGRYPNARAIGIDALLAAA